MLESLHGWLLTALNFGTGAIVPSRGCKRERGHRLRWLVLGTGLATIAIGNACWFVYHTVLGGDAPIAWIAKLSYGTGYAAVAAGVLVLLRRRYRALFRVVVIDDLIAVAGSAAIWWALLIQPLFARGTPLLQTIVSALYALRDVAGPPPSAPTR